MHAVDLETVPLVYNAPTEQVDRLKCQQDRGFPARPEFEFEEKVTM